MDASSLREEAPTSGPKVEETRVRGELDTLAPKQEARQRVLQAAHALATCASVEAALHALVAGVVPAVFDTAAAVLASAPARLEAFAHRDTTAAHAVQTALQAALTGAAGAAAVRGVLDTQEPATATLAAHEGRGATPQLVLVPLAGHGQAVGVLAVAAPGADMRELALLLGVRAGLALQRLVLTAECRASEARYRALAEQTSAIVWRCDAEGAPLEDAESWRRFTGQSPEALRAGHWLDAVHPDDRAMLTEAWSRAAATGQAFRAEHRLRRHDGLWCQMVVQGVQVRDASGRVCEWVGTHTDVTEMRRLASATHEQAAMLQSVLDTTSEAVFAKDLEGRYTLINRAGAQALRRTPEEVLGHTDAELFSPEDAGRIAAEDAATLKSQQPRAVTEDVWVGTQRLRFETIRVPHYGRDGALRGVVGVARDLTQQHEAQAAARRQADALRGFFDAPGIHMCVFDVLPDDSDFVYTLPNRHLANFWRTTPEALTGLTARQVGYPEHQIREWVGHFRRCEQRAGPLSVEYPIEHADRSTTWHYAAMQAVQLEPGRKSICFVATDISERKEAERALMDQLERFRAVVTATNDVVYDWDLAADQVTWNTALAALLGEPRVPATSTGAWWQARIHPDDGPRVEASVAAAIAGREAHWQGEYRVRRGDGTHATVLDRRRILRQGGRPVRMIGAIVDLSPVQEAAAELRRREEQYRIVTDGLPVLISYMGADLRYRVVNAAYERTFGITREQLLGRTPDEVLGAEEWERLRPEVERALAGEAQQFETDLHLRDGRVRKMQVSYVPDRAADGRVLGFFAMATDVTERHALEEQLRQSQKMEAVGRLAGGIAHDFNNLLTVISAATSFARESSASGESPAEDLDEIAKATERAAALTRQLLAFSRKQVVRPERLPLNDVVRDAERMLRRTIGEDVVMFLDLAPAEPEVLADKGQLEQVLMNLVINARDAMPQGGTLTVATGLRGEAAALGLPPGEYVELRVTDSGSGMDETTRRRVFEPFFTTKEVGKGTGLGLSTVYGIAKQGGGTVVAESTPGRGSTFRVLLPRSTDVHARESADAPGAGAAPAGREHLLLIEDEEQVRLLLCRALERQGYRVTAAASGPEALALEEGLGVVDLVISDMVMPHLSGRETLARLRGRRPHVPALLMSGYSEEPLGGAPGAAGAGPPIANLAKPFTLQALLHAVRDVLDGRTQDGTGA